MLLVAICLVGFVPDVLVAPHRVTLHFLLALRDILPQLEFESLLELVHLLGRLALVHVLPIRSLASPFLKLLRLSARDLLEILLLSMKLMFGHFELPLFLSHHMALFILDVQLHVLLRDLYRTACS